MSEQKHAWEMTRDDWAEFKLGKRETAPKLPDFDSRLNTLKEHGHVERISDEHWVSTTEYGHAQILQMLKERTEYVWGFAAYCGRMSERIRQKDSLYRRHEDIVLMAMMLGHKIPAEVLADYPEFQRTK